MPPRADLCIELTCPRHTDDVMVTWCTKFAPEATWWLDADGFRSEWVAPADLPDHAVERAAVLGLSSTVARVDTATESTGKLRPESGYFRWVFTCPRPSCNYRAERVSGPVDEALRDRAWSLARQGRFSERVTLADLS